MKTKVVISKKFSDAQVDVKISSTELSIEASLNDFLAEVVKRGAEKLAREIGSTAGNPALMMTNSQLQDRLVANTNTQNMADILLVIAAGVIEDLKQSSVVAV